MILPLTRRFVSLLLFTFFSGIIAASVLLILFVSVDDETSNIRFALREGSALSAAIVPPAEALTQSSFIINQPSTLLSYSGSTPAMTQ